MLDQSVFFMPVFGGIGINESSSSSFGSIEAFPNPASDLVNVNVTLNSNELVKVSMMNLLGETVSSQSRSMNAGSNNIQFSTYNLDPGVYLITVSTAESKATTRVVVQ